MDSTRQSKTLLAKLSLKIFGFPISRLPPTFQQAPLASTLTVRKHYNITHCNHWQQHGWIYYLDLSAFSIIGHAVNPDFIHFWLPFYVTCAFETDWDATKRLHHCPGCVVHNNNLMPNSILDCKKVSVHALSFVSKLKPIILSSPTLPCISCLNHLHQ